VEVTGRIPPDFAQHSGGGGEKLSGGGQHGETSDQNSPPIKWGIGSRRTWGVTDPRSGLRRKGDWEGHREKKKKRKTRNCSGGGKGS